MADAYLKIKDNGDGSFSLKREETDVDLEALKAEVDALNDGGLVISDEVIKAEIDRAVPEWLDEHPEATTTVEDHSLTMDKMVIGALGYVTPGMFDAVDGNGDADLDAMQDMADYAIEHGLDVHLDSDFTITFPDGSDVDNPARILFKRADGLVLDGCGHTVTMAGFGTHQIKKVSDGGLGLTDPSGSGRDVFTAFSFVLCTNCRVTNVIFKGDFVYDETNANHDNSYYDYDYEQDGEIIYPAREKAISLMGCYRCSVDHCDFDGIWGNGVLLNPSSSTRDGEWAGAFYCSVTDCTAANIFENAFNNMAGTRGIRYENLSIRTTRQGIETGGVPRTSDDSQAGQKYSTVISGCSFIGINLAVIANKEDVIAGCSFYECGLRAGAGADALFSGCVFRLNRMFHVYPGGIADIVGCRFYEPYEWKSDAPRIINANGTAEKNIRCNIRGCQFDLGTDYTIYFGFATANLSGCVLNGTHNPQIYNYDPVGTCRLTDVVYYRIHGTWTINNGAETTDHKVTALSSASTDTQYPSAKAAWDAITAECLATEERFDELTGEAVITVSDWEMSKFIYAAGTDSQTGTVGSGTAVNKASGAIEIPADAKTLVYTQELHTSASTNGGIAFYSESYSASDPHASFISGVTHVRGQASYGYRINVVDIPSGAKYVRFTYFGNATTTAALEPTFYAAFTNRTGKNIREIENILAAPAANGTYRLTATVSNSGVTYSWVSV